MSGVSSTSAPAMSGPDGTRSKPATAVLTTASAIGRSFKSTPYMGFGGSLPIPRQVVDPALSRPIMVAAPRPRRPPTVREGPDNRPGMARWSATTKRLVVAVLVIATIYIVYRAGDIVRPFVWAAILSYVLLPVVGLLERRLRMRRTLAAALVFLALLVVIFAG